MATDKLLKICSLGELCRCVIILCMEYCVSVEKDTFRLDELKAVLADCEDVNTSDKVLSLVRVLYIEFDAV